MKKKTIVLLSALCMLMLLTACGDKMKTTTISDVKDVLVNRGLYVEEDARTDTKLIGEMFAALLSNHWTVSFGEFTSIGDCEAEYAMGKIILDDFTETTGSNYSILEGNQGDTYKLIIRIDDTLLMISGPESDKSDIQSLAREIGYYN